MNVTQLADQLRRDNHFMKDVTRWEVIPARPAQTVPFPESLDPRLIAELQEVIQSYGLESWDGFHESDPYVLDGEGFWLEITLTDGTRVLARGDNAFPEHYFDAMGEMWEILTR